MCEPRIAGGNTPGGRPAKSDTMKTFRTMAAGWSPAVANASAPGRSVVLSGTERFGSVAKLKAMIL